MHITETLLDDKVTLEGHVTDTGEVGPEMLIVPENPLRLESVIVEEADVPAMNVRLTGLADIVKSVMVKCTTTKFPRPLLLEAPTVIA